MILNLGDKIQQGTLFVLYEVDYLLWLWKTAVFVSREDHIIINGYIEYAICPFDESCFDAGIFLDFFC